MIALLCLILIIPFYFIGNKRRITYFKENLSNCRLLQFKKYEKGIRKNIQESSDNVKIDFGRYFSDSNNEIYLFKSKTIVVMDPDCHLKRIETFNQLPQAGNISFGNIIGKAPDKVWLNVEVVDPNDLELYHMPDQVVEVSFRGSKPELHFYDIGKYTASTVDVCKDVLYIFREGKSYYETYNLNTKNYAGRINVGGIENCYIYKACFNSETEMILVSGGIGLKSFSGVIVNNSLIVFDKSEYGLCLWGEDNYIYYNSGSELLRYNPLENKKQIVFQPGLFMKSGTYNMLYHGLGNDIIVFDLSYSFLLSEKIIFGRLLLDTTSDEYMFNIAGNGVVVNRP